MLCMGVSGRVSWRLGGWKRFRQEEIGGGEHSSRRKGLELLHGTRTQVWLELKSQWRKAMGR